MADLVRARWAEPDATGGPPRRVRALAAVVVAVLALAAVAGWLVLRRPADATGALPRASDAAASSTAPDPTDGAAGATTSGSGPGAAAGSGADAVGGGGLGGDGAGGAPVVVHVAGAVLRPGVLSLPAGSRAVDAVAAAGGLAPGADPDRVNLAAPVTDGMRLTIPLVGQAPPVELAPQVPGAASGGGDPSAPAGPIDLNSADAAQLDQLPGVGPSTAAAIIAHRDEHGPFGSVDDLLDVRGIGEAKLDALRDLVTVGGA
jgi:competence protein ComEA